MLRRSGKNKSERFSVIGNLAVTTRIAVNYSREEHENIAFISETEQNCLSFLDIKTSRENNKFVTSVYRKPTFSGVITNFESFISTFYERNLIGTLLYREFRLCSNMQKFYQEICSLNSVLKSNAYPRNFIDS